MTPDQLAKTGTEHAHQRALFAWAAVASLYGFDAANCDDCYIIPGYAKSQYSDTGGVKCLRYMYAVPNGGERNKAVAARLKTEGVKRGVPDIMLPVKVINYGGLYVELKRLGSNNKKEGKLSPEQQDYIDFLRSQNYSVEVAYGWQQAKNKIINYLGE